MREQVLILTTMDRIVNQYPEEYSIAFNEICTKLSSNAATDIFM